MSSKRKQIHGRNPSRGDKDGSLAPVRVGGRIKKAKTIFDPSDNLYPRKRRMNLLQPVGLSKKAGESGRKLKDSQNGSRVSNGEDSASDRKTISFYQGWCLICLKNHPKLITCKTCSYKAHIECLDERSGPKVDDQDNVWLCPQCKLCTVCQKSADFGILTQCTQCYDFYHNTCHRPRIISKGRKRDKWICRRCNEEELSEMSSESAEDESAVSSDEAATVKRPSPVKESPKEAKEAPKNAKMADNREVEKKKLNTSDAETEKQVKEEKKPDEISSIVTPFAGEPVPDASTWSASEVYSYFSRHFPNEAEVFREQEIDGASLVLMKRDDVVSGLRLKLGPAIRIYRHVLMLQKRSSDPRLAWF